MLDELFDFKYDYDMMRFIEDQNAYDDLKVN